MRSTLSREGPRRSVGSVQRTPASRDGRSSISTPKPPASRNSRSSVSIPKPPASRDGRSSVSTPKPPASRDGRSSDSLLRPPTSSRDGSSFDSLQDSSSSRNGPSSGSFQGTPASGDVRSFDSLQEAPDSRNSQSSTSLHRPPLASRDGSRKTAGTLLSLASGPRGIPPVSRTPRRARTIAYQPSQTLPSIHRDELQMAMEDDHSDEDLYGYMLGMVNPTSTNMLVPDTYSFTTQKRFFVADLSTPKPTAEEVAAATASQSPQSSPSRTSTFHTHTTMH